MVEEVDSIDKVFLAPDDALHSSDLFGGVEDMTFIEGIPDDMTSIEGIPDNLARLTIVESESKAVTGKPLHLSDCQVVEFLDTFTDKRWHVGNTQNGFHICNSCRNDWLTENNRVQHHLLCK